MEDPSPPLSGIFTGLVRLFRVSLPERASYLDFRNRSVSV